MIAPREVFALESLTNKILVHSVKGPLVFVELEDAMAAIEGHPESTKEKPVGTPAQRKAEIFGKKWAVCRILMNDHLGTEPFTFHAKKKCDLMEMPANSIYLADLRDQVALAANAKQGDNTVDAVMPDIPTDDECLALRAELKGLGVNVRAVRKIPRLREMLAEAQAKAVPA